MLNLSESGWDGELARALRELELDGLPDDHAPWGPDALAQRAQGTGDPLLLSAPLGPRLEPLAPGEPEAFWTLYEPDTVGTLLSLAAAAGASAVVAPSQDPVTLLEAEDLPLPRLYDQANALASRAPAPFSVATLVLDGPAAPEALAGLRQVAWEATDGLLLEVARWREARPVLRALELPAAFPVLVVCDQPEPLSSPELAEACGEARLCAVGFSGAASAVLPALEALKPSEGLAPSDGLGRVALLSQAPTPSELRALAGLGVCVWGCARHAARGVPEALRDGLGAMGFTVV